MKALIGLEIAMVVVCGVLLLIGHSVGLAHQTVVAGIIFVSVIICPIAVALAPTEPNLSNDIVSVAAIAINVAVTNIILCGSFISALIIIISTVFVLQYIDWPRENRNRLQISVSLIIEGLTIFAILRYGPMLSG